MKRTVLEEWESQLLVNVFFLRLLSLCRPNLTGCFRCTARWLCVSVTDPVGSQSECSSQPCNTLGTFFFFKTERCFLSQNPSNLHVTSLLSLTV